MTASYINSNTITISISEDCNDIKVELEESGNFTNLDTRMFGRYVISSQVKNNREVYLSEDNLYTIWYSVNETSWILSRINENGKIIDLIYLDLLSQYWKFYEGKTFVSNANGTNSWNMVGKTSLQVDVHVRCSSKTGKSHLFCKLTKHFQSFCRLESLLWWLSTE